MADVKVEIRGNGPLRVIGEIEIVDQSGNNYTIPEGLLHVNIRRFPAWQQTVDQSYYPRRRTMVTTTPARAAAEFIFESYRKVQPFERLPVDLFPKTLEEAYAIQLELHCMLSSLWGPLAGYKLAYTTPVMQERAGLNHPVLGGVFQKTILRSPVGVTLGKDLPASGAPYTRDSVAEAVSEVATAFEIVDMRTPADLTTEQERTLMSVAVNILNSGVVLGDPVTDWQSLGPGGLQGRDEHQPRAGGRGLRPGRDGHILRAAGVAGQRAVGA
ncbi:hypothetical protein GBAR_LOCUS27377 [Geodia barretti]|uniref:Uncharacterized protein n=1 Tax=Geodia barretti TaxID=519541 RepID=A0AA35TMH1_GEOBA|nr:hypothetical protein GBAR_LOCUS27377 [Geodia barretti]